MATIGKSWAGDSGGDGIPASALAGSFVNTAEGSLALCFSPSGVQVPCGTPDAAAIPFTLIALGELTNDGNGNACESTTQMFSDLPVDASPPGVAQIHIVSTSTSYDPETGIGDGSFITYPGGKCVGANFDKTGATAGGTGTFHLIASKRGKRTDYILTRLPGVGEFSIAGYSTTVKWLGTGGVTHPSL